MFGLLILLHVVFALLLIGAVLMQSGKGASNANIFGGRSAETAFGASTPAILNKITTILAAGFIFTSLTLALLSGQVRKGSAIKKALEKSVPEEESVPLPAPAPKSVPIPKSE